MDFFDAVNRRFSCRSFKPEAVEIEKLNKSVEAAAKAPSTCNNQPWKFILVSDPEVVASLKPYLGTVLSSNVFARECSNFAVLVNEGESVTTKIGCLAAKKHFSEIDCGIAVQTFCLAAAAQEVDTCILGLFNEKRIKKLLGIPGNKRVMLVIACGYAKDDTVPKKKTRKPLSAVRAYDNYTTEKKNIM